MYRYLISGSTDPHFNLATEEALVHQCPMNCCILFIWQNERTIVIGRNQDAYIECRVDAFVDSGGKIARRRSGGGAVYHDLGNLNFSLICRESLLFSHSSEALVGGTLERFGIHAASNGRNDLLVNGQKVSGNASYTENGVLCRHATLMVSVDIDAMTQYLTPQAEKLNRNHVNSVYSRVLNLNSVQPRITVPDIIQAMVDVSGGIQFTDAPDLASVQKLRQFYDSPTWIFGGKR